MAKRTERRSRRRWPALVGSGLLVLLFGMALSGLTYLMMSYPNHRGPGRGRLREVTLTAGASVEGVAAQLSGVSALAEPRLFAWYATLLGAQRRLRVGTILIYDSMTPRELLQRVATGFGSAQLRVVIPEGFSRFEIAARLARFGVCDPAAFLSATQDTGLLRELGIAGATAEGYLFPDTYLLREQMSPAVLVRRFVANARRRFSAAYQRNTAGRSRLQEDLGWGEAQVLTLASIVEKEARLASEQPIIAGVFLNRLRTPDFEPRRLQADPTVAYGCLVQPALSSCADFDGRTITRAMLAGTDNAYNTYRVEGLPPGPIANPGVAALQAVLAPARHGYLYFVLAGGGRHAFSATLGDHQLAVQKLRAGP